MHSTKRNNGLPNKDWGGALLALLMILASSFFGTLLAGLALIFLLGLV